MKKLQKRLFILLIVCLPFNVGAIYTHLVETDLVLAFDALLGLLYVVWFINTDGFSRQRFIWGKITLPFVLFLLWIGMSALNAISITMLGLGLYMTLKSYFVYLYVINNVKTRADLNSVLLWFCVGLCFQGCLGIIQYTTGSSLGLEFLGALSKNNIGRVVRVRGTLALPNRFGAWLVLIIPIAASLFLFASKPREKLFYGGASLLGVIAILLSFSRSAWAGLLGGGGVLIFLLATRGMLKGKYILGIVVTMLVVAGLVVGFWDTIMLRFETGATGKWRLVMIDIAMNLIKENFLAGVGLMNYKFHQIEYFKFWQPVHNTYLRLAAEIGIPGLFFFLTIIYLSLREGYRMLRCKDQFVFAAALGLQCSLWSFLFTINFGPEYAHYRVKFLLWFVIGIIFSLRQVYNHTLQASKARQQVQRNAVRLPAQPQPDYRRLPETRGIAQ